MPKTITEANVNKVPSSFRALLHKLIIASIKKLTKF